MEPNIEDIIRRASANAASSAPRPQVKGCYRVPDGYFSDMKNTIVEKAQMTQADNSWSSVIKRLLGFSLGFAVMVAFALGIVYLTPENAMQAGSLSAENSDVTEFTELYNVSEDDILSYYYMDEEQSSQEAASLSQAIDEYIAFFGIEGQYVYVSEQIEN